MKVVEFWDEADTKDGEHGKAASSRASSKELLAARKQLPVYRGRRALLGAVFSSPVTIIVGETGSGKSTQLPQLLLEENFKERIVVTQPRRVAAMSLAHRVADEMGCNVGEAVGYQVRFQARVGAKTQLRYMTDGMLLREFMLDKEVRRYSTIIIDEAHERTVVTDLLLGLLKRLLRQRRRSLRVVVMSATLDADRFASFFDGARVLYVPGRTFPVERFYVRTSPASVVDAAVRTARQINAHEATGDILVFLAGQEEIEAACEMVRREERSADERQKAARSRSSSSSSRIPRLVPIPFYASLPEAAQRKAFEPAAEGELAEAGGRSTRKVIFATNIAETSVTIPGVRYVVDSGLRKVKVYRSKLGLDSLLPAPISQASAAQRAGRAGREAPGKCFRLFTEREYMELAPHSETEIVRVSVAGPILTLKNAGVDDVLAFEWVEPPKPRAVANALLQLYALRALDDSGRITPLGRQMVTLPVDPSLAAVLIGARTAAPHLRDAAIDVAACLNVPDLLLTPRPEDRSAVAAARAEKFPAGTSCGDLALVKQLWDQYTEMRAARAPRRAVLDWAKAVAVNARALRSAEQVRAQLCQYLKVETAAVPCEFHDFSALVELFLRGFVTNTAIGLPDGRYQTTVTGQPLAIHPSSALFGQRVSAILYLEYIYTSKAYARLVSPIEVDWLRNIAPQLVARGT